MSKVYMKGKKFCQSDTSMSLKCRLCGIEYTMSESYVFCQVNGFCSNRCWKEYHKEFICVGVNGR